MKITSVHVFHGILCLVGVGELDIGEALADCGVLALRGQLHHLHHTVSAEDLHDVLLADVAREAADVDTSGARGR